MTTYKLVSKAANKCLATGTTWQPESESCWQVGSYNEIRKAMKRHFNISLAFHEEQSTLVGKRYYSQKKWAFVTRTEKSLFADIFEIVKA